MILLLKSYPYHFVRTILSVSFCPIPFCPYTILSIPFCPYHFVRYHFVLEPVKANESCCPCFGQRTIIIVLISCVPSHIWRMVCTYTLLVVLASGRGVHPP